MTLMNMALSVAQVRKNENYPPNETCHYMHFLLSTRKST
ncbi:hypothetical protein BLL52_0002 [Rhodoferax antarcticus ANT.BR]|uniref:Uncharacterized protein n=1 Tax=Rhodoferax antarcticus ANT.BR TaxID=1111071 RepID=A0A1Q8YIS2_9BURK|nr:hypothetical protein BLL52_1010 [Rhodoferax antarcticus ANT.BR]OLP08399.1 hypothetical protein BLL52_0002 [Rhodoferax antarcticus ANT.BR]